MGEARQQQGEAGEVADAHQGAQQRRVGENRAMAQGFPVGPPQPAQRPPALVGPGVRVEIGGEPEAADQEGQGAHDCSEGA